MSEAHESYDYDALRAAARTIKASLESIAGQNIADAALLLARYADTSLNLSDEVDGRRVGS